MKANIKVLYAQFGFYTDEKTKKDMPWANLYSLGDIVVSPNMVGLKPAKMAIVDNLGNPSHAIAEKIMEKIAISKSHPVNLDVIIGTKVVDGVLAMQIVGIPE